MVLRAVTLDAAGTLFAPREPVGRTYARVAARHGIALDPARAEAGFRRAFAAAPPLAFPGCTPEEARACAREWWRRVVAASLGAAARAPGFDACFAELFAHYARGEAWRVFPEVPDALAALRRLGLRLAVVSNFDARLAGLLDVLGLAPYLDAVLHSSDAGAAKPDPALFHAALARLGTPAAAALHAGDSATLDVAGARAAGLRAVLVDREGRAPAVPPGVPVVATLAALPTLVE